MISLLVIAACLVVALSEHYALPSGRRPKSTSWFGIRLERALEATFRSKQMPPSDGPPDLDELWNDFNKKLERLFRGRERFAAAELALDAARLRLRSAAIMLLMCAVSMVLSGFIKPNLFSDWHYLALGVLLALMYFDRELHLLEVRRRRYPASALEVRELASLLSEVQTDHDDRSGGRKLYDESSAAAEVSSPIDASDVAPGRAV